MIFKWNFLEILIIVFFDSESNEMEWSLISLPPTIFYYSTVFPRAREILFKYFENNAFSLETETYVSTKYRR